jgi:small-conductance mechanosensitive channel
MDWNTLLVEWIPQAQAWLQTIFTLPVLRQLGALAAVLLLGAPFLRRVLNGFFGRLQPRLDENAFIQEYVPSVAALPAVIRPALGALSAWLLGLGLAVAFTQLAWADAIVAWFVPLLGFWFGYRLLQSVLVGRYSAERAAIISQKVLRPLLLIVFLLHSTGLLVSIFNAGFRMGDNRITVGGLLLGLILLIIFSRLSRSSVALLGEKVLPKAGVQHSLTQVLATFVGYIVIIVGVLMALSATGIPLTALSVIAGGLVVGFGFGTQEIVSNFISGFILLFEGSIGPGDVVQVDGTMGTVKNVGIRAMRIKNLDNVELIVPNNHFLTQTVTNYARAHGKSKIRVHVPVGVSYEANPHQVVEALLAAAKHPAVLEEPAPSVQFADFADSSLNFDLMVWTREAVQIPNLRSQLRFRIWDELDRRRIEIPFPQRDIHIRSAVPWTPAPNGVNAAPLNVAAGADGEGDGA